MADVARKVMNSYLIGKYEDEEVVTSFKILSNKEMGENLCKLHIRIRNVSYFFFVSILKRGIMFAAFCRSRIGISLLCQHNREKTGWGLISNQFSVFITLLDTQTRL